MSFWSFLFVPTVLFMVIVAPIWIVVHYRAKNHESVGLSGSEQESLDNLLAKLDQLTDRIHTLEEILDAKHPDWQRHSNEENAV